MTFKQFWVDPRQTELQTTLTAVNGHEVQVAQTIFYAESGGQESDHGTLAGQAVLQARKQGMDIIYTLASTDGMQEGQRVTMQIDWPRRWALMRLHFAAELMLELVYRRFPATEKIGAHIAADKARIDFVMAEPITPHLPALQQQLTQLVAADLPITSAFSDEAAQRRYWQIEGFARVPCGGTHLARSSEVGAVRLKRKNIGQGKERIEIYLL
ncbi:alanyl-tRNA editing protein [Paludibacterium sp. THUN1379]|uniref:alanyl-tRNA editing protein n=1 Tax=Paludibacterium sp. THUN1379 TaxID=3112107 RepID=UPI00308849B2|nr:alanyl-tRNA editing protein [Paludibacterium sp. THUN1379]